MRKRITALSPQEKRILYEPLETRKIDVMFSRIVSHALAVIVGIGLGLLWAGMQG